LRARAPGKLVLSGAYAVLEGAPSLVAAVDRYAVAEAGRPPTRVTEEVAVAMAQGVMDQAPWFDASALRTRSAEGERKLGLGSSAAILTASIAASWLARGDGEEDLGARVLEVALVAHRGAQHGGSGVDVAAACLGGVLCCQLTAGGAAVGGEPQLLASATDREEAGGTTLEAVAHQLPTGLCIEVYRCSEAASTRRMLAGVARFCAHQPVRYQSLMAELGQRASRAAVERGCEGLVAALGDQLDALSALGRAAEVPIVTDEMAQLDGLAREVGACFAPSGAGGGDVAMWMGSQAPPPAFQARAEALGLARLPMGVGARGVHRAGV
jgi:phosphomevalonate kinase